MPSDREAYLKRIDVKESAAFKEFDEYLMRRVDGSNSRAFQIAPPPGLDYNIRLAVFKAWREAGWNIDYHDDQRDGAWITIST
jgi:hypothetical protein